MKYRTVINKIVFTSPEAMEEFSGGKKLKLLTSVNLYSFERSRNFFHKIIRLQVTLQPRYAKNVIRYAFMLKGSQSHVFA